MAHQVWWFDHYGTPMPVICRHFVVGDIVTRDGRDEQRVIATTEERDSPGCPEMITVECIKEPPEWLLEDGTRDEPWCKIGDIEENLTRRYRYVDEAKEREFMNDLGLHSELDFVADWMSKRVANEAQVSNGYTSSPASLAVIRSLDKPVRRPA